MTAFAIIVAYSLVGVFTMRRFAWIVYDDVKYTPGGGVDGEALIPALVLGWLAGLIWPLTLTAYFVWTKLQPEGLLATLTAEPKHRRRERELREREARIERLEREVGVGG